ncbi:ADP-ribosylglycohydrolase family protein [Salmonella enterica]|nr:ADP-ribosylglycohydrolase family protein [Salmonella enterica]EAO0118586.1 ADP-ribosylglycohydrolase family protein [Salmonella enterica]EAO3601689.1 ADP-ribosylglycohydrolase family protein [Salmonella enterica]EAR6391584.1 ADP-ribosylglycohydrolase family protein [Salmonella enterica]EAV1285348.1 ADP-ribosylglycohydrolase family protein [Salmonella enterica]
MTNKTTIHDAFRGCMLGAAVGDAIGLPVEFMGLDSIRKSFGPEGIKGYAPCYGGVGLFSDDTQMSLFTAEGLLWADAGESDLVTAGAQVLINWLKTQGVNNRHIKAENIGLVALKELHTRRAPGNTCLSSLSAMQELGQPASNNSKGCGAVMRMHPVGLYAWAKGFNAPGTLALANRLGGLTHAHHSGYLSGGAMAVMVRALLNGFSLSDSAWQAMMELEDCEGSTETIEAIKQALALADTDMPTDDAIKQLGEGWVGEEALAVALYCALKATSFSEGVLMAANHSGDSDSTASIAGALLGLIHGDQGIPQQWLRGIEQHDVLYQMAENLFNVM